MKILLIDSIDKGLNPLKRELSTNCWQVHYVDNPFDALNALTKITFDVVISAQNTQEIQGDELLRYVTKHFPSAVRILVNDPLVSDTISTDETVDVHYRFNQPLNPEEILSTIERFAENKTAITKEAIIKTVAKVKTLPSPPKVYLQLNALLKTASNDVKKITEIIIA